MNIIVIVRQTPDTEAKIKISSSGNKIENDVTWIINPYDEFAIEKALKIKEKLGTGEVTILLCGHSRAEESIRQALAMGADKAIFLKNDDFDIACPYTISKIISSQLKETPYDLILTGKKVIDLETSQIPALVATELGLSYVSYVVKIEEIADSKITVDREVDGEHEIVEATLPTLITCDRGDDIPRYASITGIMKAKKKEIKEVSISSIPESKTKIFTMDLPPPRKSVQIFDGNNVEEKVQKLVKSLREESKVI